MEGLKRCTVCKESKGYADFGKNKSRKDGYHNACRVCKSISDKKSHQKHREKRIKKMNDYYQENREKLLVDCKVYRDQNKEAVAECKRIWATKNKERKQEQERRWKEKYPERFKESQRRWYKSNKDKVYASLLRRRSLKHFVRFEGVRRTALLDRDNWKCRLCGVEVHDLSVGGNDNQHLWNNETKAHIDHIIPISKGGDSTPENLQVLCRTCNLTKSAATQFEIDKTGQIKLTL